MKLHTVILLGGIVALQLYSGCGPGANPRISLADSLRIGDGSFIRIDEVQSGPAGSILVTDAYRFGVKEFSTEGVLLKEFGSRGPGEAQFQVIPSKMVRAGRTIGIIGKAASSIRFFDTQFSIVKESAVPGNVIDAVCDGAGNVFVNLFPFSGSTDELLMEIDAGGNEVARLPMNGVREEPALNMANLSLTSRGELVVAHRFLNDVALYGTDRKIRKAFNVDGWPAQAPSGPSPMPGYKELPRGDVIADLAVDPRTDYLFVLGGEYSTDPYRDVQIYDRDGTWLAALRLPEKSGLLYIDDAGHLFTREKERTVLMRYNIVYENTHD